MNSKVDNNPISENTPIEKGNVETKFKIPKPDISAFIKQLKLIKSQIVSGAKFCYGKAKPVIMKNKKVSIIGGASIVLVLLIILFVAISGGSSTANSNTSPYSVNGQAPTVKPENPIHDQLDDISAKLANIEQNLSQDHAYVNLDQVRSSVSGLQSQVSQLADRSNQIITQQIKASTAQLQGQLVTIKKELAVITAQKTHHKMLNPSNLPFKVMSIDNIQESEVVTIDYDHRMIPVDIGDSIANWALVSASSVDQKAQFRNKNDDYVAIDLNNFSQEDKES